MDDLFVSENDLKQEVSAKEDIEMKDSDTEDDPVVQEFPVHFSNHLCDQVYLFQYPVRSSQFPLVNSMNSGIMESRIKPKAGYVEVDIPIEKSKYYDESKGREWKDLNKQTWAGVENSSQEYMAGIFKNGELHLTPISSSVQIRPQFNYVNAPSADKDLVKLDKYDSSKPVEARAVQMTVKSASETLPRFSGALESARKLEEEKFISMEWYDRDTDESWAIGDKLIASTRQKLESSTSSQDYLKMLNEN